MGIDSELLRERILGFYQTGNGFPVLVAFLLVEVY